MQSLSNNFLKNRGNGILILAPEPAPRNIKHCKLDIYSVLSGVGGTAKSGLFGVTINSNVGQLRLAYPQAKEALKNLDQSIKVRDFQDVKFIGKKMFKILLLLLTTMLFPCHAQTRINK